MKVLVLGYGGRVRAVDRWRMRVALQTLVRHGGGQLVVSGCGGEAERLVPLAPPDVEVTLETTARNTRENVERSLPLLEDAERFAIASDYFHERRAARYLQELRPDLASRLVPPVRCWPSGSWAHTAGAVYAAFLWFRFRTERGSRTAQSNT